MQVIINEAEIKQAIREYVLTQVPMNPATKIDIDLKATRGEAGYQAFISIERPTKYDIGNKDASVPEKAAEKLLEDLNSTKASETEEPVQEVAQEPQQDALANQDEQPNEDRFEVTANKQPLEIAKKVRAARKPKEVETVPAAEPLTGEAASAIVLDDPEVPAAPATIEESAEAVVSTGTKLFKHLLTITNSEYPAGSDDEDDEGHGGIENDEQATAEEEPAPPKTAPVSLFGKPTATTIEPDVPAKAPVALFGNLRRTLN